VSSPQAAAAAKSGRELLAKSSGSMLGLVRVKLKGRRFVNDILGKTALARAKRRVVIARKLELVRQERARLRQTNVSPSTLRHALCRFLGGRFEPELVCSLPTTLVPPASARLPCARI
jgi:hypothetical protein